MRTRCKDKKRLRYFPPVFLLSILIVACFLFLRADDPAPVVFTADTILSLDGIVDGDLYIAQGSGCTSLDIAGADISVSSIPEGSFFTLKTAVHERALKVSSTSGNIDLDFSGSNLLFGEISSWTATNSGAPAVAEITWGVPGADTYYLVKVNGSSYDTFLSDSSLEIIFSYDLVSSSVFTLEIDEDGGSDNGGGSPFLIPPKPDISEVVISPLSDGSLTVDNLPDNVIQVAISSSPDFSDASWEYVQEGSKIINGYDYSSGDELYIKFRSNRGRASDIITYQTENDIKEGDIVKTADNFDVYIIKYNNGKRYKRLILNPQVFDSYEHLKWENIKIISQKEMDSYSTSTLVKETYDSIVYELYPDGDTGARKTVDLSGNYDADSVYEINQVDRDSYILID